MGETGKARNGISIAHVSTTNVIYPRLKLVTHIDHKIMAPLYAKNINPTNSKL